jgi:hypothetical protein
MRLSRKSGCANSAEDRRGGTSENGHVPSTSSSAQSRLLDANPIASSIDDKHDCCVETVRKSEMMAMDGF